MASKYFNEIRKKIPQESKIFVTMSLDIIDQVHFLLDEKGITQRELAKKLGKSESEISRWLSSTHNMTLKTLSKLSAALDGVILETPLRKAGYYDKFIFQDEGKTKTKIVTLNKTQPKTEIYKTIKYDNTKHKIALA